MKRDTQQVPVVEVGDVAKSFRSNGTATSALADISLIAHRGELTLLLGPSGSGKTTLLTLIAGLVEPTGGKIRLFGKSVGSYRAGDLRRLRATRLGFIFQNFMLIDSLTVLENILLVLRYAGFPRREARRRALRLLGRVNISHLANKYPGKISQGEKQRVAIARALANGAELILADEPTASLDTEQGLNVIQLLRRVSREEGCCVIVATHDTRLIDSADRIVRLKDGRITEN